jgi:hypothetical protein
MSISNVIISRSNYWYTELNYALVRFDIDFVVGNLVDMSISGVSIVQTPFDTDQVTTMTNLIASINNTGIARAELYSADTLNRTLKIYGLNATLISIDSVVVTGGAIQPVATIIPSRYADLVNAATNRLNGSFDACGKTNYVIALMIMHWLALEENSGGTGNAQSGSIKSKKEGDLSVTYGTVSLSTSGSDSYWMQTPYGAELIDLRDSCFMGLRNRMVGVAWL